MVAGAVGGAVAALAGIWLLGGHPGGGAADLDAVRGDLRRLADLESARGVAVEARLAALEERVARVAADGDDADVRRSVADLAAALAAMRESVRFELAAVDVHLRRLREALDEPAGDPADSGGPLDERGEPRWVVLASDPDPGVRFSALALLGRRRTDRSVAASRSALHDPEAMVVWQAVRNVGSFADRGAARDVTPLLTHPEAVVRAAAHIALLRLGAPPDIVFDPVGDAHEQSAAVASLTAWAESAR